MKWLFVGLLVLNLGLLGLQLATPAQPTKGEERVPLTAPGVNKLMLLSERPGSSGKKSGCFSFGPFDKPFKATEAMLKLRGYGVAVERRTSRGQEQSGYWVYLPPFPSKEAAAKMTQQLAYKKVENFFIVLTVEKQNAISLGVYKTKAEADLRGQEVRDKGFEPVVEPRYIPINLYWLDFVEEKGDADAAKSWAAIQRLFPEQHRVTRDCDTAAAEGSNDLRGMETPAPGGTAH